MIAADLKPELRGLDGQLVPNRGAETAPENPADVRRAVHAAGRQLDWRVRNHAADSGILLITI